MIDLKDPRWGQLTGAYGPAIKIPELLRQLEKDPSPKADYRLEPWFSLWSALCHQRDIYTASYAAVPHIVQIGSQATGEIDRSFLDLPIAIVKAMIDGKGPSVPSDLASEYFATLPKLTAIRIVLKEKTAFPEDGSTKMDTENGMCRKCGHAFNPHLIITTNGSATKGGIMLCQEDACFCFHTWGFIPKEDW
jgi:hypothetical protein